jgi:acetyltransferase-like isoleucine patch superfamily enzyme
MSYTDVEYKFKKIGKNVQIGKNVYFRYPELVEIGDNVIIDDFCYFTTGLKIDDYVHIGPHCSSIGGKNCKLIMHSFSGLSAGVRVICASNDFLGGGLTNPTVPSEYRPSDKFSDVELKKHVIIGTSAIIYPGVIIEEGSAVGALGLVTKSLDEWGVFVGQPVKRIKDRPNEIINKLEIELWKKYPKE